MDLSALVFLHVHGMAYAPPPRVLLVVVDDVGNLLSCPTPHVSVSLPLSPYMPVYVSPSLPLCLSPSLLPSLLLPLPSLFLPLPSSFPSPPSTAAPVQVHLSCYLYTHPNITGQEPGGECRWWGGCVCAAEGWGRHRHDRQAGV